MKRIAAILLIISALLIWYFKYYEYPVQQHVRLNCHYMAYACGDCTPQYKVDKISPSKLKDKLLYQEIDLEFKDEIQEQQFNEAVRNCAICYDYSLQGDLFYSNPRNCYVLKLQAYKVSLRDKS